MFNNNKRECRKYREILFKFKVHQDLLFIHIRPSDMTSFIYLLICFELPSEEMWSAETSFDGSDVDTLNISFSEMDLLQKPMIHGMGREKHAMIRQ
jgi:hypothetical protein